MTRIRLHGASYSVYTRIARLILAECALSYDFIELDIFDKENLPAGYLELHPFSKIPVLEQGDVRLFETDAIAQYLVALAKQERFLPADPLTRARCLQLMRILDNYAYPKLVWGIWVEDQERGPLSAEAIAEARNVLRVLESFDAGAYLSGHDLTLADIWALPMITYLQMTPRGSVMLSECSKLSRWFGTMGQRASVQATRFPAEHDT
ncbi:glutathione S-transferase family protein [Denitrobaculum tricleocarpae]|uniref:Glutathione S-transferase family protein n=1 Tax=Denitrobaculum tricleocarpae TaxID=2591009 RepID=A0A545TXJ7_9PROT|nr:glutathione S-transferase family protein [Denitrobaculum tricleocarpae]TQV81945.1 glutathione S-transferase family protein [Denitrobaculum tricleocarpae]